LRILVSSIQVIPEEHCFEKWANFPAERDRLFDLIRDTGAGHVVVISGDRHLGEISRLPAGRVGYPLYEVTASGMNSAGAGEGERNRYRVTGDNFREDHFGVIRLSGAHGERMLSVRIIDIAGNEVAGESIPLDRLRNP
jgi:alkaline phosphatase D